MRLLGLLLLVGCSFPRPPSTDRDAAIDGPADGPADGPGSGSGGTSRGRRIQLTIASGQLTEALTDFPVYVDITDNELKTQLDVAAISFRQRSGGSVTALPYEVQSFDKATGRLRAWVLLPALSSTANNVFELQYGHADVTFPSNPPEVWRNHFKAVFHLERSNNPIADARNAYPGTAASLSGNASQDGKLGKGLDFDNNRNSYVAFANPLVGSGPSTISTWVSSRIGVGKETLVLMGNGQVSQARYLYAQFNNEEMGLGLYGDDWLATGVNLENQGWRLVHWTYDNKQSRLYHDGAAIAGSPFTHNNNANTQGASAYLGNGQGLGFDNDATLNGMIDEVRISDVARSPGWIAAEFANQSNPTAFIAKAAPSAIP